MEIWKDIPKYEGLYQASSNGRIRSNNGIRKLTARKDGYLHIPLCKDGKSKYYLVHRLIAVTFIDNPHNYKEVNHKDENKTNNSVDNLEWCNRKYNVNYGTAKYRRSLAKTKKVIQYSKNGELIKIWDSLSDASKSLNIKLPHIIRVCQNKRKSTGGFVFKYVKEICL